MTLTRRPSPFKPHQIHIRPVIAGETPAVEPGATPVEAAAVPDTGGA